MAAIYVDGAAILGADRSAVEEHGRRLRSVLNKFHLECPDLEEPCAEQTFTGLCFKRDEGTICASSKRLWTLRLALAHALWRNRLSSDQLRSLVGHFTWVALLRREALSVCSAVYSFIDTGDPTGSAASSEQRRLWPSVRRELHLMSALLPLLSLDARRPWSPIVYCSDAEGAGEDHCGGWGVCYKSAPAAQVAATGRVAERWRYDVEKYVAARRTDLVLRAFNGQLDSSFAPGRLGEAPRPAPVGPGPPEGGFSPVPAELMGSCRDWTIAASGRWKRREGIMRGEGRALVLAIRHALLSSRLHGARILFLVDNMALALGVGKGRGSE